MEVTGRQGINQVRIPAGSKVGREISSVIGKGSAETDASVVVSIKEWGDKKSGQGVSVPPPSGDIVLEYFYNDAVDSGDTRNELRFEGLPENYVQMADTGMTDMIQDIVFNFKRVIDHSTSTEYVFDDSGDLIPQSQYDDSEETSPEQVTYKVHGDVVEGDSPRTNVEDSVMNRSQVGASDTPEQRFCTGCGEDINDSDAAFCPYCGTEL